MAGFLWSFRGDLGEDYVALPKISSSGEEIILLGSDFCMLIDGIQMINHTVCCLCKSVSAQHRRGLVTEGDWNKDV